MVGVFYGRKSHINKDGGLIKWGAKNSILNGVWCKVMFELEQIRRKIC